MTALRPVFALFLLPLSTLALAQQPAASRQALNAQAMTAYENKDFATCAALLGQLVDDPAMKPASSLVYNAACCQSLAGDPKAALALLDRASSIDMLAVADVDADADLAAVRALPEWPALRDTLVQREDARLAGLDRELRKELLARQELDQDIRRRASAAGNPLPKALADEFTRIDHDNTEWMKTVLARHGWPGKSLVGKDGARAAWLFVQHADMDKPFQKEAIKLLEAAVAKGEAEGKDLAYLTDRVLVGEGKPQRYGTQFHEVDGKLVPQPIEDAEHVDARRAAVGLMTLAEYDQVMQSMYKPAAPAAADP